MPAEALFPLAHNAMSTLEVVKAVKKIAPEDTSYDAFLTLLINYASGWIERQAGRPFGLGRFQDVLPGSGLQELVLRRYPIREIHSITDLGSGAVLDMPCYSFQNMGHVGVVYKDDGWTRKGYASGLVPDYILTKSYLRVDYTAGYVLPKDVTGETIREWILPYDLQGIVWQIVAMELDLADNNADGLASFTISDVSWSFDKAPRQSWLDIIATYKEGS